MRHYFQNLYDQKSMSIMDHYIDEQCLPASIKNFREYDLLLEIYRSNDLDERRLICAEYLGYTDEAENLRQFIVKKKALRKAKGF